MHNVYWAHRDQNGYCCVFYGTPQYFEYSVMVREFPNRWKDACVFASEQNIPTDFMVDL